MIASQTRLFQKEEASCFAKIRNREVGARFGGHSQRHNSADIFRNFSLQVSSLRLPPAPPTGPPPVQPSTACRPKIWRAATLCSPALPFDLQYVMFLLAPGIFNG